MLHEMEGKNMPKLFFLMILCLFSVSAFAAFISSNLVNDPDLPTANLYSSGPGDSAPANLSSSTDAIFGQYSLRVQSGTIANGGGTLGGMVKSMPSLIAGKRYSFMYWAKALTTPFSQTFSFQSGGGDSNNMSHSVTLNQNWQEYSYTVVLDAAKPVFYTWAHQIGGVYLIDNIRVYEVSADVPIGLAVNTPEPCTLLFLFLGCFMAVAAKTLSRSSIFCLISK